MLKPYENKQKFKISFSILWVQFKRYFSIETNDISKSYTKNTLKVIHTYTGILCYIKKDTNKKAIREGCKNKMCVILMTG
jgi:hypothetical protein